MLAWILILGSWIALVSLILHDVTQEDANGGAIRLAAGHVGAAMSWAVSAVSWAMLKARTFRETRRQAAPQQAAPQEGASRPPPKRLLALRKPNWWHTDQRISMTATELEGAIAEAVRKASPACEGFLSVIVEPKPPKSRLDPDWDLRGVRFGKVDRKTADEALSTVVKRMQQEIRLKQD
jgi:transposase InsO family protein